VLVHVYVWRKTDIRRSGGLGSLHQPWQTASRNLLRKLCRPRSERWHDCRKYHCEFHGAAEYLLLGWYTSSELPPLHFCALGHRRPVGTAYCGAWAARSRFDQHNRSHPAKT
jgi:hypothetical protein